LSNLINSDSNKVTRDCTAYLIGMFGAELIGLASSDWGAMFHVVILFSLIAHAALVGNHPSYRLFLVLSLGPLIRVVSITMPLDEFSETYSFLLISIPVLVGVLGFVRVLGLRPEDIGFTITKIPIQVMVAIVGIGFGLADYYILEPEPLVSELTWQKAIVPALILMVSVGFVEEFVFRGVMQRIAKVLGSWGWVYIAVLYAVLQIGHESVLHCILAFEVALFYGWVVKKWGSMLGVVISHGLMSVYLYLIFPLVF